MSVVLVGNRGGLSLAGFGSGGGGGSYDDTALAARVTANEALFASRPRVLASQWTPVGTPASAVETDLWTYVLPANTLNADGKVLRLTFHFKCSATAGVKTAKIKLGTYSATMNGTTGSPVSVDMTFVYHIVRLGASSEMSLRGMGFAGGSVQAPTDSVLPAENTAAPITMIASGIGVSVANDLQLFYALVEALN